MMATQHEQHSWTANFDMSSRKEQKARSKKHKERLPRVTKERPREVYKCAIWFCLFCARNCVEVYFTQAALTFIPKHATGVNIAKTYVYISLLVAPIKIATQ